MWQLHNPILLEAGPGRTLGVLAMQHPDRNKAGNPVTISSLRHHYENQSDVDFLWHSIGKLWLSGAEINWENLHRSAMDAECRCRLILLKDRNTGWKRFLRQIAAWQTPQTDLSVQKNSGTYLDGFTCRRGNAFCRRALTFMKCTGGPEKGEPGFSILMSAGFASQLMTRLKAAGQDVVTVKSGRGFQQIDPNTFTIEAANAQHYDLLIRSLQANKWVPDCVVHAWSLTGSHSGQPERRIFQAGARFGILQLTVSCQGAGETKRWK